MVQLEITGAVIIINLKAAGQLDKFATTHSWRLCENYGKISSERATTAKQKPVSSLAALGMINLYEFVPLPPYSQTCWRPLVLNKTWDTHIRVSSGKSNQRRTNNRRRQNQLDTLEKENQELNETDGQYSPGQLESTVG